MRGKIETLKRKLGEYRRHPASFLMFAAVCLAAAAAMTAFGFVTVYILVKGIPNLNSELFAWKYNSENVSLMPALLNTVLITVFALAIAVPVGIGAAVYLTEYAKRGNRFVGAVRITAETLSGIPSIVYGLFGALFFVKYLNFGLSLLSGAVTLAVMILPLIMRTAEEALIAVPDSYREGSFGLGAGRLRTVFRVVLPDAVPGIMSGIILSVGKIVGESAALIFTAGTVAQAATSLFDSARTLAVHMYVISGEGLYIGQTYATAVVLLVFAALMNLLSSLLEKKIGRGK